MSARQDAAVRYASHGWPVFPCKADAKEPVTRHGVLDADTDLRTVTRFWERHPDANVAIRAGLVPPPMAAIRTPPGGGLPGSGRTSPGMR
jgi:Bifunctional DNA primase/polymerase, N-terminal